MWNWAGNGKFFPAFLSLCKGNIVFQTLCSLWWEIIFCRGLTSSPAPRSSVRRRAMFLVVYKAGLSGECEQKYGKMFNCSSLFFEGWAIKSFAMITPHAIAYAEARFVFYPLSIFSIFLSHLNGNRAFLKNNFIISPQREHCEKNKLLFYRISKKLFLQTKCLSNAMFPLWGDKNVRELRNIESVEKVR